MSYHLGPSPIPQPLVRPRYTAPQPVYEFLPLAQVPSQPTGLVLDATTKRVLIAVGLFLLAVVLFYMFRGKPLAKNHRPIKRASTPELAKNLYDRLERRGGANEATMRSLKAYSRKK